MFEILTNRKESFQESHGRNFLRFDDSRVFRVQQFIIIYTYRGMNPSALYNILLYRYLGPNTIYSILYSQYGRIYYNVEVIELFLYFHFYIFIHVRRNISSFTNRLPRGNENSFNVYVKKYLYITSQRLWHMISDV